MESDKVAYLTQSQIDAMADAAVTTYEVCADWTDALRAAVEFSMDEYGVKPRKSAALLALKLARLQWQARAMAVREAM